MTKPWKWLALVCMVIIGLSWVVWSNRQAEQAEMRELEDLIRPAPVDNIVLDELTAVRLAVVILEARFSLKSVLEWHPYRARLAGDRWIISAGIWEPNTFGGGFPEMVLSSKDGRVLQLSLSR